MNVHFIQHEVFEAPGAYLTWAKNKGHKVKITKVFDNQFLPESVDNIDMLVVMGGPQSPNTTIDECSHFDAEGEIRLIQKCIETGKAVIGVCLGSQLLGEALGARFEQSPVKEIGIFPIHLTEEGLRDTSLSHFGPSILVGHWHNDMPGLTAASKVLASSKGCPRQIVAYSELVYGFQCHMEFTPALVGLLAANEKDLIQKSTLYSFVQKPEIFLNYDYTEMNENLFLFLDKLTLRLQVKY